MALDLNLVKSDILMVVPELVECKFMILLRDIYSLPWGMSTVKKKPSTMKTNKKHVHEAQFSSSKHSNKWPVMTLGFHLLKFFDIKLGSLGNSY